MLCNKAKFGKKIYTFSLLVYIEIFKKIENYIIKYYFLSYKVIDNNKAILLLKFYTYNFWSKFKMAIVKFQKILTYSIWP